MFKKSILIVLATVIFMLVIVLFTSMHQAKHVKRDPHALMSKYYRLKVKNPSAAHRALLILLAQEKSYPPALEEAALLNQEDPYLDNVLLMAQQPTINWLNTAMASPQWGYLRHYVEDWWSQTQSIFLGKAEQWLSNKRSYLPVYQTTSHHYQLLSPTPIYVKKTEQVEVHTPHPSPTRLQSLKQAGYLAIKNNRTYLAIDRFTKAYALSQDPTIAMQLGYLYDQVNNKPEAYRFFQLASHSRDQSLAFQANNAMTNLSGLQTKGLPTPYFSEVFFNPFTESRFGLTVRPFVARLGVEQNNVLYTKQYVFFRRTDDNKSMNLGQLSQIYEDNVQITGVGGQITPIPGFPLVGFLEAGTAYDLVYRDRERWRGDFRSGLMYYNEFGARPAYFDQLTLSTKYYSDLYGEATYFTRYRNVIAGVKTHQGIRLLQYHSSMVSLYATGRAITDTQREFYNNFAEIGPGIEWIPTNRLNIKIRLEHVNGVYLPAGATPNPYSQYYTNNLAQLLFYVKV